MALPVRYFTYWKTTFETYGVYVTRKSAKTRSVKSWVGSVTDDELHFGRVRRWSAHLKSGVVQDQVYSRAL